MDIQATVANMTLEEKAGLLSGLDFWHTKPVPRLGVESCMVSDGPHGLRKQDDQADHLGVNDAIKAVCFPAGCATAASFDRALLQTVGEAVGDACQHEKVSVVLGPAVNIKRSPLCGRNFEYYSEDPYLAGEAAVSFINGVQSRNVGTSIKHFAANSQEHRRMSSNSVADERTLREIYLPAFEAAVKRAQPWTVMCSYNLVNGTYACENRWLLTELLRNEWGFKGYVMSDWGAVDDRVECVKAGLDLEMPASAGENDKRIVQAVQEGKLDEKLVDLCCERILTINQRYLTHAKPDTAWSLDADHELARALAAECMVLLKNEDALLPLHKGVKLAVIGQFAKNPRYQGGGSSHINSHK
ncbi:MAG TPA: glycoside hydrolase family 3 N-terminal domain-containing protein, partial [Candidatus Limiplasma sp.]|nr:glycoside hydrolase family 3 N-terminal domain-containing protein [Candidatus Limiplasma sp.]